MGEGGFGKGGFGKKDGKGGKKGGKKGKKGRKGQQEKKWTPVTKLGRLVQKGEIKTLEEIYLHSLPVREFEIIDELMKVKNVELKEGMCGIHPVQKMTSSGQRNRFVAYVLVGDGDGHVGFGSKTGKEVALAIRGAVISAKLSMIPVRRGYWGNKIGSPHTVPMKVHSKCGSVSVRLIPAPRGTGIVGSPNLKLMMSFAGIKDVFSCSSGHTRTKGNFMKATFEALRQTYCYITPDLWPETAHAQNPYKQHSDLLARKEEEAPVEQQ